MTKVKMLVCAVLMFCGCGGGDGSVDEIGNGGNRGLGVAGSEETDASWMDDGGNRRAGQAPGVTGIGGRDAGGVAVDSGGIAFKIDAQEIAEIRIQGPVMIKTEADQACAFLHPSEYLSQPNINSNSCYGTETTPSGKKITYQGSCFQDLCIVTPIENLSPDCSRFGYDSSGDLIVVGSHSYEGMLSSSKKGYCWNGILCEGCFNRKTMTCKAGPIFAECS